jgi:hypothetical protein
MVTTLTGAVKVGKKTPATSQRAMATAGGRRDEALTCGPTATCRVGPSTRSTSPTLQNKRETTSQTEDQHLVLRTRDENKTSVNQ